MKKKVAVITLKGS